MHGYEEGQHGHLLIQARMEGATVILCYRDDGRGMAAEIAAQAFEPFFTTRRGSGGSGLGLHLVFNLTTQLLGGHIELHSAPGLGCEFVLRIPTVAPQQPAAVEARG